MKACINCANTKCANYGKPFNPVCHMHKTDIYNCEYREDVTMLDEVFNNRKIKEQRRTFAYNHARSNGKARLIHLIETKYKKKRGSDTV